jgi:hypothetical protein
VSRTRKRVVWAVVLWTMALLIVALVVAGEALSSLYTEQQVCFLNFPAVACPGGADPAVARLTFAFFGVPAIWLLGALAAFASWAVRRNHRPSG